jgi:hypothetical protein
MKFATFVFGRNIIRLLFRALNELFVDCEPQMLVGKIRNKQLKDINRVANLLFLESNE